VNKSRGWRRLIMVAASVALLALLLKFAPFIGLLVLYCLAMAALLYNITGWVVAGFQNPN
jgi:hypothetical protein